MVNSLVGAFRGNASFRPRAEPRDKQRTEGDDAKWYCELDESGDGSSPNGRFLRHRFSPKPKVIATQSSLPKRNHVAKEAVSAAWQTKTRQRSERISKPNDAPKTKPRPCVKTMLCDRPPQEVASFFGVIEVGLPKEWPDIVVARITK